MTNTADKHQAALSQAQVLEEFQDAGALLHGHFVLSSGLHSDTYLQCARVLMDSARAARLCSQLAHDIRQITDQPIDLVVSPAMGGVVVGYETARQLGVPSIFFERVDGELVLRRGFEIKADARCVMVEDIVTTGLSSRECIEGIRAHGGRVVAAACLIDRSSGQADIGAPMVSLAQLKIETYSADELPADLKQIPAVKPGSRDLNAGANVV